MVSHYLALERMSDILIGPSGAFGPDDSLTREQRRAFVETLKGFALTPEGFRPIEEAIITSGGVDTRQVNPKNMESKLLPGLFFAGEILDVDGYTGGFNLQIAFSTAVLAAEA